MIVNSWWFRSLLSYLQNTFFRQNCVYYDKIFRIIKVWLVCAIPAGKPLFLTLDPRLYALIEINIKIHGMHEGKNSTYLIYKSAAKVIPRQSVGDNVYCCDDAV